MKKHPYLLLLLPLIALLTLAYVPALTDFNINQFGTTATGVAIKSGVVITNAVNWGSAFSSRSGSAGGEQFGNGATASGASGTAVGNAANANGPGSGTAIGSAASAAQLNGTAVGTGANVGDAEGTAIGASSAVLNGSPFSTAIGYGAVASAAHKVFLGTASEQTVIPNLSSKTIVESDLNSGLASIANSAGVLTNDGSGNFSWVAVSGGSGGTQLWGTNATTGAITNLNGGGVSIGTGVAASGPGIINGGAGENGVFIYADPQKTNGVQISPSFDLLASNNIGSVTLVNGTLTTSGSMTNKALLGAASVATDANGKLIAGSGISSITLQTNGTQLATGITTVNLNSGANIAVTGSSAGAVGTVNIAVTGVPTQGGSMTNVFLQATNIVGIQDSVCMPASAFFAFNLSLPASAGIFEQVTNIGDGWTMAHGSTNEVRIRQALPFDWNAGTVKMEIRALSTGTNDSSATNVVFGVAATMLAPETYLPGLSFGTQVLVTNHISVNSFTEGDCVTGPITVGNTPTGAQSILWQIQRLGSFAGDTETNTLVFTEARVYFTRNLTTTNSPASSP